MRSDLNESATPPIYWFTVLSVLFYLTAIVLVISGLVIAYHEPTYASRLVGGDAYNHIIFATRGTAWVGAGIVAALIALGLQIISHVAHYRRSL